MASFANLSFETAGASAGAAASWTWTRSDSAMSFSSYATPAGFSRFDGFEFGWGVDNFIDALTIPGNATPMEFGTVPAGGVVTPYEDFERGWRLPNSHVVDPTHPGNETALFEFGGASAVYSIPQFPPNGQAFESFEAGWPSNEVYFTAFTTPMLKAAAYATTFVNPPNGQPFEDFEEGWLGNENYLWALGAVTAGTPENFETVKPDQLVSADPAALQFTTVQPHGFSENDLVSFYQGSNTDGTSGILPTGISPLLEYNTLNVVAFKFRVQLGGSGDPVPFTDPGKGPIYVSADPTRFWTWTNVGV